MRKRLHHTAPEEKLPPSAYLPGANARVNTALLEAAQQAARSGQAVIVDGTFLHPPLRHGVEAAARTAQIPFLGLWLEAAMPTMLQRVATRAHDASDAGPDVLRHAAAIDPGRITWPIVPAENAAAALAAARAHIAQLPIADRSAPSLATPHLPTGPRSTGNGPDHGE